MTASPKRRRNRTIAGAVCGVLVLGAAPTMGYAGWHVLRNSKAGTTVAAIPEVAFPSTPTAMIATVDDQNLITSLAVLVLAPGTGKGGTLVAVPTNANRAQSDADDQTPIADSMINGGEAGLVGDAESLMRVTIGFDTIVDASKTAALLAPLKKLTTTLPNDVVDATATGTTQTLFTHGTADLTPAQAASVLTAVDPAQAESKRLPNVHAVWNAVAAAVGTGIDPAAVPPTAPTDMASFLQHFFAGPIQVFNDLATDPITGKENPNKLDLGRINIASVVLLMAGLAPSAMIAPYPTVNFRIENGITPADIAAAGLKGITPVDVTRNLVERLIFLQGNVISVSPEVYTLDTKKVPDTTTIFATGGADQQDLNVFTTNLGTVEFKKPVFQFPLVGVVIVVGRTYLADMAKAQADKGPVTTTGADSSTPGAGSTDVSVADSTVTS